MYYCNNTENTISQTLSLKFEDVDVFSRETKRNAEGEKTIDQTLEPNSDDCIVIKRTGGACSYSVGLTLSMS